MVPPVAAGRAAVTTSGCGRTPAPRPEYAGRPGRRFAVWPGSAVARQPPRWVVAAELVETSRLWARTVAKTRPEWAEEWPGTSRSGSTASRTGPSAGPASWPPSGSPCTAADRRRSQDRLCRIAGAGPRAVHRHAARSRGDWETRHAFFAANRALGGRRGAANRVRRRGWSSTTSSSFASTTRGSADVVSGGHFDAWWKHARRPPRSCSPHPGDAGASMDTAEHPAEWRRASSRCAGVTVRAGRAGRRSGGRGPVSP